MNLVDLTSWSVHVVILVHIARSSLLHGGKGVRKNLSVTTAVVISNPDP